MMKAVDVAVFPFMLLLAAQGCVSRMALGSRKFNEFGLGRSIL